MRRTIRLFATTVAVTALSVTLSGCLIAAVPLVMAAGAAAGGFAIYKTVQTTSGGSVRISFDSKDAKKASPPPPLPSPSATVAVIGAGVRDKKFSDALQASGKFRVSQATGDADGACRARRVDLVMSAVDQGQAVKSNMLSFQRGNVTQTLTLQGYSCASHMVAWTQSMQVIVEAGSKPTPQNEIDEIAGQAWADRVIQARG
jgi:hypothetical protein